MNFEYYYDDENSPVGLFIRHDNLGITEYDDDHAVFVDFREQLFRPQVTVVIKEPLTIKEKIECSCGAKFTVTNSEAKQD